MKVLVPLAEGFEEIEAVTIIDVLRRANIDVTTAYLDKNPVMGTHDIPVTADKNLKELDSSNFGCIILPGGMPGSNNLKNDSGVITYINDIYSKDGIVSAVCAAPIVLGNAGVLQGKNATCSPGFEKELTGASYNPEPVIVDGRIITGKGPGCAIPFVLKLVEEISGADVAENIKNGMQVYWM